MFVNLTKLLKCPGGHILKILKCHQQYTTNVSRKLTADVILSDVNLTRSIECMSKMPPLGLKTKKVEEEDKLAAVLIAICIDKVNELSILFTRRSGTLSRHVRQISFPGGIKDSSDEDFVACALRETEEEIGLPRSRVGILGVGNLIQPPHTAAIAPVIGVVQNFTLEELKINEGEVDEAFTISIGNLANPKAFFHTQFKSGYSAPVFMVEKYKIWGITGYLTHRFLNCIIPPELNTLKKRVKFIKPYERKEVAPTK